MLFRKTLLLLLAVGFAAAATAQSVHWETGDSGAATILQLVFEDCEPDGDPQLPQVPNASLSLAGSSTSVNMVNMSVTRTLTLSYVLQTRRAGPVVIPAFIVKTNKGSLKVATFTANGPAASSESFASSKLIAEKPTVWAGEVFGLTYQLTAARRANPQLPSGSFSFDWNSAPAVTEQWANPSLSEATVDGQRSILITTTTRGYIKTPNTVKLDAAHQVIQVQTGTSTFGLFVQPRMEPVSVTSDQPTLEVRPLPSPPADFTGAVGHFKLESKVVPREAGVGEPVTWTLELSGTGNWPDISGLPAREVSKDFQVVQPKAKRTNAEGKLFDATLSEDVVLVPTKAGKYTLGPVAFTFFNPQSGKYETLRTERVSVTINAPAGASAPSTTAPSAADEATPRPNAPSRAPETLQPPAGIPRDPLPGHDAAARPVSMLALAAWLTAPVAALVLLWLALAWRRALRTDPLRPRREAHARLTQVLGDLATTTANEPRNVGRIRVLLSQWQRETAVIWNLPHAAPKASELEFAAPAWAPLWREAERVLYSANAELPADWVTRAEAALETKTIRPFNPLRLFLPQNLLAFAAALAALLAILPAHLVAAEATAAPEALYRSGDFAGAEKVWRAAVSEHPTDWIARHNLALALAQQDRTGEAMAEAVVAFVQHPTHPSVRWHLALLAGKSGYAPAVLQPFLKEGPAATLATLASAAVWQRVLIACGFLLTGALAWLLVNAYSRRERWQTIAALAVCVGSFLAGAGAIFGVVAYGETIDTRAVITWEASTLRSIPTEADTTQKTTALPAGSIALVDKTFLGWVRLTFDNGQTGWVRKAEVVPLWRAGF